MPPNNPASETKRLGIYYAGLAISVLLVALCFLFEYFVATNQYLKHLGYAVVAQYSLLSGAMLLVWWAAPSKHSPQSSSLHYKNLIIVAILLRIALIFIEPYTSNDIARYLFDGRIALEGLDPYRIAHDAIELETLRAQWSPPEEHAKYVSLYPPIAMLLFSIAAATGLEFAVLSWKLLTALASIATLLIGAALLRNLNKLHHLPLIALSPVLILEAGEAAHLDAFVALSVVAALYFWQRKSLALVAIILAIGGLIKLLPIVLLGPLFFLASGIHNKLKIAFYSLTTFLSGYGIAFLLGFHPIGSIDVFFEKWRFGSPLFHFTEQYLSATTITTLIFFILFTGYAVIAYMSFLTSTKADKNVTNRSLSLMQWTYTLPLLLSPVVFTWYLMPLVVLGALRPSLFILTWTILLPLSYEVIGGFLCCDQWTISTWPIVVLGGGLLAAMAFTLASMMIPKTPSA